jgi:hypothetical protein
LCELHMLALGPSLHLHVTRAATPCGCLVCITCCDMLQPASCSQMARMADRGEIDFLIHTGE